MLRKPCRSIAVAVALGAAGAALAQPPGGPVSSSPGAAAAPSGAGKFPAIPGLFPLSMSGVQREIGLNGDQRQQLKAISDRYAATLQQLGAAFEKLGPQEKQERGKDVNEQAAQAARNAQRKAESVLTPQQLQAVKKIAFELSATFALADPKTQEKIGLSAEQRQRLNEVFEQAGEKMQQLQRETSQRTLQLLDEEQAAALKAHVEAANKP